ncbi:hypothetical protein CANARDRAFT_176493 [[Candida] arabinofermentans NRRL YB-2248]|uniref:Uncharacterized protein n=1 Tax=[Candida] arabinofermentans NRRL YB-2248 TaxID=983967 RepID=A0A1E4T015_9ASCO|nr:hypothetical protein CANARDRAFT_176493 [[Candida] arabinofermentans NRRL YB-2248]
MPITQLDFEILEFDLDGTIVDSTQAIEKSWDSILTAHPHLNEKGDFFHQIHGVRVMDVLRKLLPNEYKDDKEIQNAAYDFDRTVSVKYGKLNYPIKGAPQLFSQLEKIPSKPFCIVTSGSSVLAQGHFDNVLFEAGIVKPEIFIVAEDVQQGKPHPQGYLRGASLLQEKLGLDNITKKVVFEDAPAGLEAGNKSGATTIGICSSFDADHLYKCGATYAVEDLSKVKVVNYENNLVTLEVEYIERS